MGLGGDGYACQRALAVGRRNKALPRLQGAESSRQATLVLGLVVYGS